MIGIPPVENQTRKQPACVLYEEGVTGILAAELLVPVVQLGEHEVDLHLVTRHLEINYNPRIHKYKLFASLLQQKIV